MAKKMNITKKDLDRVKEKCLESLGDFLSELCRDKLLGPTCGGKDLQLRPGNIKTDLS